MSKYLCDRCANRRCDYMHRYIADDGVEYAIKGEHVICSDGWTRVKVGKDGSCPGFSKMVNRR